MRTRVAALLITSTFFILIRPAAADGQIGRPYPGWREAPSVAVRLDVDPDDAEVFVDGYLAGTVDDFDGVFQRLRLRPGEHEIAIHRDGYRVILERRYFNPGATLTIRRTMEPLGAGEAQEPRPMPSPPRTVDRGTEDRRPAPPPRPPERQGTLVLRVQPADAELTIDGARHTLAADQTTFRLPLAPGRHRVEVRRDGYETYVEEVLIRPDATLSVDVTLKRR